MEVTGQLHVPAALPREKNPGTVEQEAAWVSEHVWTFWRQKHIFPLPGLEPRTFENFNHSSVVANARKYNMRLLYCILRKWEVKKYTLFRSFIAIQKFQQFTHEIFYGY
jgi:hypothetical protein